MLRVRDTRYGEVSHQRYVTKVSNRLMHSWIWRLARKADSCAASSSITFFFLPSAVLRTLRFAVISPCIALFMTRTRLYDLGARGTKERTRENRPCSTAIKMLLFLRLINTYLHPVTFFILPPPRTAHSFLYLTIASCEELKLNAASASPIIGILQNMRIGEKIKRNSLVIVSNLHLHVGTLTE